jgi:hypothetical protein
MSEIIDGVIGEMAIHKWIDELPELLGVVGDRLVYLVPIRDVEGNMRYLVRDISEDNDIGDQNDNNE